MTIIDGIMVKTNSDFEDAFRKMLDNAGYVKAVRCGDCVYMEDLGSGLRQCNRFTDLLIDADDYCSKGARRT